MKKILLLVAAISALATTGSAAKGGGLVVTCLNCGNTNVLTPASGYNVQINGSGYQSGGHNQLSLVVFDSAAPVDCTIPDKQGNFTCTTTIAAPGWYNFVAYQNSKTVFAATGMLID